MVRESELILGHVEPDKFCGSMNLWQEGMRPRAVKDRVCILYNEIISKINFSHWKTPGVSERIWSVNLDASILGKYQTPGGHSCRPSE